MKITKETVLRQIGYRRIHVDDLMQKLGIKPSYNKLRVFTDIKRMKLMLIMIQLLFKGIIDYRNHECWIK